MERLKTVLKIAFAKGAIRIRMKVGEVPQLITVRGPEDLLQEPRVDTALMKTLYKALFPKDQERIAQGAPTRGQLTVVEKGKLNLIAEPGPTASLNFYIPPGGDKLFTQNWIEAEAGGGAGSHLPPLSAPPLMNSMPSSQSVPQKSVMGEMPQVAGMFGAPPSKGGDPSEFSMNSVSEIAMSPGGPPQPPASANGGDAPALGNLFAPLNITVASPATAPIAPKASMAFVPSTENMFSAPPHSQSPPLPSSAPTIVSEGPPVAPSLAPAPSAVTMFSMTAMPSAQPPPARAPVQSPLPAQPDVAVPVEFVAPTAAGLPTGGPAKIHFGAVIPGTGVDPSVRSPIDDLLRDMCKRRASDLHLTLGQPVCFRIDGDIHRHDTLILTEQMLESFLLPIMPITNRGEFARNHDTDFAYEIQGLARFRVNMFRDRNGVGAVLRQIPSTVLTADQLGLPISVRNFCNLHRGLVVVTGPTGSGKSTTLAAMVDTINMGRSEHILTIEDPIEFVHQQKKCLVNQREVHRHTESFSRALRAALREDPDIVLIGEMRDLETVGIAIETAETGHLVFGTLHTNTAISTIDRIIDQFPEGEQAQVRIMLAESLKGVVAQTLCKKRGGGRIAALEVLVVSNAVSSLIREGKTFMIANVMQTQRGEGNRMLNDSLFDLVQRSVVDAKEAWLKAADKENFIKTLQAKGISVDFLQDVKASA